MLCHAFVKMLKIYENEWKFPRMFSISQKFFLCIDKSLLIWFVLARCLGRFCRIPVNCVRQISVEDPYPDPKLLAVSGSEIKLL